jgi:hypothetical protein
MSQQQTLSFPGAQSRSNSTHPPTPNEPEASTSTKRSRKDQPEREQPTVPPPAFEHVIKEVNEAQARNFELMNANFERALKDAIHQLTLNFQKQHEEQILSLEGQIAGLKTSVNRLERAHLPVNTQQQPTNKNTTPAANTTQNTQQERGRSRGRTPNPPQQSSQRQNSQRRKRGTSDNRRLTFSDIASLPPTTTTQARPPPKAEREIIVSFKEPIEIPANEASQNVANLARIAANKALSSCEGSPPRPLLTARFTSSRNLIFTTNPDLPGSDYTAYLSVIADGLKDLGEATATLNERWTKFLIHNVPTSISINDIRNEIETHYPQLKLAQTPRWLKKKEDLTGKKASAIVIALLGSVTLEGFGLTKLAIANNDCKVSNYHQFANWTQCHKCQQLGHPQDMCTAQHFTCGICASPHATRDHPCNLPTCKQGPACTHPPNKCVNCNSTDHKSMDRNCPTRAQTYEAWKTRRFTNANTANIPPPPNAMDVETE